VSGTNSHFSVGGWGELIFTKGKCGGDLRPPEKAGKWDFEKWVFRPMFIPFSSHFCPIFLNHTPPQPSTTHIPCAMLSISPFLSFSPHFPFFQTPKSWFGELVSSVAVSADACHLMYSWGSNLSHRLQCVPLLAQATEQSGNATQTQCTGNSRRATKVGWVCRLVRPVQRGGCGFVEVCLETADGQCFGGAVLPLLAVCGDCVLCCR